MKGNAASSLFHFSHFCAIVSLIFNGSGFSDHWSLTTDHCYTREMLPSPEQVHTLHERTSVPLFKKGFAQAKPFLHHSRYFLAAYTMRAREVIMQNQSTLLSHSYCVEFPDRDNIRQKVCEKEIYGTSDKKSYCVLHHPCSSKCGQFWSVVKSKLDRSDFKFTGVWFADDEEREYFEDFYFKGYADFSDATFSEDIHFRDAKFDIVRFTNAKFDKRGLFTNAEFRESVYFDDVKFMEAEFGSVVFQKEAVFNGARFDSNANFFHADFFAFAQFRETRFKQLNFSEAVFAGISFDGAVFGYEDSKTN